MIIRDRLLSALTRALEQMRTDGSLSLDSIPAAHLYVAPTPEQGDFSSDVAITLSRQARQSPLDVAQALAARLELPADLVTRVAVSPSGFLNFHLREDWPAEAVRVALRRGNDFGKSDDLGRGERVQVEFVSANPTGPLTLAHGRGAALGDSLARVLEWSGFRVTREFFINDAGTQTERFGKSLEAHYLRAAGQPAASAATDAFAGAYVQEIVDQLRQADGDQHAALPPDQRLATLTRLGAEAMVGRQRETLARFGVRFDQWSSEKVLQESGALEAVLELLRSRGHLYEQDGALWLRTTTFGDQEDRPLRRSNGQPTYLAGDLAYHLDKFQRDFQRVIDVWGPEHGDYAGRTRAAIHALGFDPAALEIVIFGAVALQVDERRVESVASSGNNLTLDEVIEQVGAGTARFLYLSRPAGAALEFDLDLARSQGPNNPLSRVRDAYAAATAAAGDGARGEVDLSPLSGAGEQALMRRLALFGDEVRTAARERDPHRLTRYALEVAEAWEPVQASGATGAAPTALATATATVLRNTLTVLGLNDAP